MKDVVSRQLSAFSAPEYVVGANISWALDDQQPTTDDVLPTTNDQ